MIPLLVVPPEGLRFAVAAFAALSVAFVVINAGLRLTAEGRRFLAEARRQDRLFAHPSPRAPRTVQAIFALAGILAALAAALAYAFTPVPRPQALPSPIQLAEACPC